MKRILAIGVILLFIGMSISSATGFNVVEKSKTTTVNGKTLYVGGSGPNNYTKIQDAIDNASDGDTIYVYNDSSPYAGNITVDKSIKLIGENRDSTIIEWKERYGHVVNLTVNGILLKSFTLIGGSAGYSGYGIIINSNNNYITDTYIKNNSYGIRCQKFGYCTYLENLFIGNSRGISLYRSNGNNLLENYFSNHLDQMYLGYSYDNIISNNTFCYSYKTLWQGVMIVKSSNNSFTNNSFFNCSLDFGSDSFNWTISNNTINGKPLFYIEKSSNRLIEEKMGQVIINNCNNITVKNQEFEKLTVGIQVLHSKYCTLVNNILKNTFQGIELRISYFTNISGNSISNSWQSLLCSHSNKIIILNNKFLYGTGLDFGYCRNTTIKNNIIFNNTDNGIRISGGNNYKVINNFICNNKQGISLKYNAKDSKIWHNDLISNQQNAFDDCNTIWNDTYPSGGNYWDDYTGNDSDGEGIGDIPYPIPGGDNEDYYPLMELYGNWNIPPLAKFNWTPLFPNPNEMIFFNASESIDYDGCITLYEWDWNNDGIFDENHTNSTVTHSWSNYGQYPVTLRVTDDDNLTDYKTKTIKIENQPPDKPSNPYPPNDAANVSIFINLSWVCSDPNGDLVTFDVYFGTTNPPPKVASNVTEYNPGILDFNTTYDSCRH